MIGSSHRTRRTLRLAWPAALVCGLASIVLAANATAQAPPAPRLNPELVARNYAGANGAQPTHALTVDRLDVAVDIVGGVARTTVTAGFDNPTASALEGDFTLHLPAGAVVTGYALDVNGAMVDGVLAGKRRATLAYQAQVRRGADPGLAEATRDEAFRTHVFPIFPGRGRTVRLEFVAPVPEDAPLILPLSTLDPVGAASITVKTDARTPPTLEGPEGLDLRWTPGDAASGGGGGLEAHATAKATTLSGALRVGSAAAPPPVVLTRSLDGDRFFEIEGSAPSAPAAAGGMAVGGRVRICWQASLARRRSDLEAETALLARYLDATKPRSLELVVFADAGPRTQAFATPAELVAAVRALRYDGATSLTGVVGAGAGPADACVMFSNGRVTVDAYAADRAACPLFTVSSAEDADHAFLTALARKSGGEHVDLRARGSDAALAALTRSGTRVTAVRDAGGQALDFTVLPSVPGRFRVVGRSATAASVAVTLADGRTQSFDLGDVPVAAHPGLGALWAADRIGELTASDRPDPEQALNFARRYGVAAGDAVFLVLERVDDYAQAGIAPPDSAGKEMQADYTQALAARDAEKAERARTRLAEVVAEWNEEKNWWAGKTTPAAYDGAPPVGGGHPHRRTARDREAQARPIPSVHAPIPEPVAPPQMAPPASAMPPPPPPPAPDVESSGGAPAATSVQEVVTVTAARAKQDATPSGAITVAVEPWNPDRPYLAALRAAAAADYPAVFAAQEKRYGTLPAFYLDTAELAYRRGRVAEAAHLALDALELPTADTSTLVVVADRMMRYGDEGRAIWAYERVLYLDPDRPQPRRSLALALAERAERGAKRGAPAAAQRVDYARALDLLNEVAVRPWDHAFDGIELVALVEANRILPRLERLGGRDIPLDPRLRALLDVDLRVVLEWNVDATDMDLWVDEPDGERAIYSHPRTRIGGRLSHDMTQGYGPEEYLLRRAPSGEYTVRVNIFRTDRLNPNGPIDVRARLFRGYGRADETSQVLDLELKPGEDGARVVGSLTVAGEKPGR